MWQYNFRDDSDALMHWKYVSKKRGKNGKWRYVYANAKNKAKRHIDKYITGDHAKSRLDNGAGLFTDSYRKKINSDLNLLGMTEWRNSARDELANIKSEMDNTRSLAAQYAREGKHLDAAILRTTADRLEKDYYDGQKALREDNKRVAEQQRKLIEAKRDHDNLERSLRNAQKSYDKSLAGRIEKVKQKIKNR